MGRITKDDRWAYELRTVLLSNVVTQ